MKYDGIELRRDSQSISGTSSSSYIGVRSPKENNARLNTRPSQGGRSPQSSYTILDEDLSKVDSLHLLGRFVQDVRRPLANYVPTAECSVSVPKLLSTAVNPKSSAADSPASASGTHDNDSPSAADSPTFPPGTPDNHSPSAAPQASNDSTFGLTAEKIFPECDPTIFVSRDLPLSETIAQQATLSQSSNYSANTRSLLTSLLGLTLSSTSSGISHFELTSKLIRTVSLRQHPVIFSAMMHQHGKEIKEAVKIAGGTMYFVTGVKMAVDAAILRSESTNTTADIRLGLDASMAIGMRTLGSVGAPGGVGNLSVGRTTIKGAGGLESKCVPGERAFAMEYCSVTLRRKAPLRYLGSKGPPVGLQEPDDLTTQASPVSELGEFNLERDTSKASDNQTLKLDCDDGESVADAADGDGDNHIMQCVGSIQEDVVDIPRVGQEKEEIVDIAPLVEAKEEAIEVDMTHEIDGNKPDEPHDGDDDGDDDDDDIIYIIRRHPYLRRHDKLDDDVYSEDYGDYDDGDVDGYELALGDEVFVAESDAIF